MTRAPIRPDTGRARRKLGRWGQGVLWYSVIVPAALLLTGTSMATLVHGRRHFPRHGGAVIVCNHVHPFDELAVARAAFPRRVFFASQPSNFSLPVAGAILRYFGTLTLEPTPASIRAFHRDAGALLAGGGLVAVYPEGRRHSDAAELQQFHLGALDLAQRAGVPVVPLVIVPTGRHLGVWWRRGQLDIHVTPPVMPQPGEPTRRGARTMQEQARHQMASTLQAHGRTV